LTRLLGILIARPYQFWANVSDLYLSWSKVAVATSFTKMTKKLDQWLFDASMSIFMETTQKIEKYNILTTE